MKKKEVKTREEEEEKISNYFSMKIPKRILLTSTKYV